MEKIQTPGELRIKLGAVPNALPIPGRVHVVSHGQNHQRQRRAELNQKPGPSLTAGIIATPTRIRQPKNSR